MQGPMDQNWRLIQWIIGLSKMLECFIWDPRPISIWLKRQMSWKEEFVHIEEKCLKNSLLLESKLLFSILICISVTYSFNIFIVIYQFENYNYDSKFVITFQFSYPWFTPNQKRWITGPFTGRGPPHEPWEGSCKPCSRTFLAQASNHGSLHGRDLDDGPWECSWT